MKTYTVTFRNEAMIFTAEDKEHAIEQFLDAITGELEVTHTHLTQ